MNSNTNEDTRLINNDEDTRLINSDESTQLATETNEANDKEQGNTLEKTEKKGKNNTGKTAKAVGGFTGAGILLGSAAAWFSDLNGAILADVLPDDQEQPEEGVALTEINPEETAVISESVINDDMSFEEAFAAARDEFGPGSAFEWRGNVYATYTTDEWDGMSDEEKSVFYDQINLPNPFSETHEEENDPGVYAETIGEAHSDEESGSEESSESEEPQEEGNGMETEFAAAGVAEEPSDGIEVVTVGSPSSETSGEDYIEILGMEHHEASGANIATMNIDGEEVFVVDVDGDMVFDAMVVDVNHDGEISDDEIINIQDAGLSVDSLGGFPDPYDSGSDMMASNDEGPDYMSDYLYEC